MKVRVQVMIEQDVFDQLKIEADEKQVSVSAIIRQKIKQANEKGKLQ